MSGFVINPFKYAISSVSGTAGGRGVVVQVMDPTVADPSGFDNVSGNQTITMASNFTVGNSVVVDLAHYQSSSVDIASVTIAGTSATKTYDSGAGNAKIQSWYLDAVVNSGRADVVIAFVSGAAHYLNAGAVELSRQLTYVATATGSGNTTTPNATSTTPTQCEVFYSACWRDATGVNNTAPTPIPSGWTREFFVADGATYLGGAAAVKLGPQTIATTTVTFSCSAAVGFQCRLNQWNWVIPNTVDVGTSVQFWAASDAWAPTTQARVIADTTKLLVTCGAWWDGNGLPSALPTDSSGTVVAAVNPSSFTGNVSYPLTVQIGYVLAPSAATHTLTPPAIQSGGDGYFTLLELSGIDGTTPVRETGTAVSFHTPVTPPDSGTYQTITVETSGSTAQVGDTAVAIFMMDPNSTSNSNIAWVPPSGWWVLENKFNATDCIGYLLCCATVLTAGKISATATWTDANTFVAGAAIVVFKKA